MSLSRHGPLLRKPWQRYFSICLRMVAAILAAGYSAEVYAQAVRPGDRPAQIDKFEPKPISQPDSADWLPEVPSFIPILPKPSNALPDLPPELLGDDGFQSGPSHALKQVTIDGNSAVEDDELARVVRSFVGLPLSYANIIRIRDALTNLYVERGYATSGAVVPDQDVSDGVLTIEIVEGTLSEIEITTNGRLRPSVLEGRISRVAKGATNTDRLRDQLRVLQMDDRIKSVRAELVPTGERGTSVLRLEIDEARPWQLSAGVDTGIAPTLGEVQGRIAASHLNVTGFGDTFGVAYRVADGLHDLQPTYSFPIPHLHVRLDLSARFTWSEILESPFDRLEIESKTRSFSIGLEKSIIETPRVRLDGFLRGEYRESDSFLLGDRFSFVPGPDEGRSKISVLRAGFSAASRGPDQVLAARVQASIGVDALGATTHDSTFTADSEFVSGLIQMQWVRRLSTWGLQLRTRADLQLASDPLLGLEQFSLGGRNAVRGYRENELVRDNGVIGSVEFALPFAFPRIRSVRPQFEISTFVDAGYGWNENRNPFPSGTRRELVSAGLGLRAWIQRGPVFEIIWGEAITNRDGAGETRLQDQGLYLGMSWSY